MVCALVTGVQTCALPISLKTADLARTFSRASSALGKTRPNELSMGCGISFSNIGRRACTAAGLAADAMHCLTMRSSREWKLITAKRPPGDRQSFVEGKAGSVRVDLGFGLIIKKKKQI